MGLAALDVVEISSNWLNCFFFFPFLLLYSVFNKYRKRRVHNTANLLTGEADVAPGSMKVGQGVTDTVPDIISYYHPNLTINLVEDYTQWAQGSVPQPLDKCTSLVGGVVWN